MKRRALLQATIAIPLVGMIRPAWSLATEGKVPPMAFGFGGRKKMTYDVRQRPQAVYFNGKVFIGYTGGGSLDEKVRKGRIAKASAKLVSYDPKNRVFSDHLTFGKPSGDHHDCPVLWVDNEDHLHFLYGCHNRPGVHLVAKQPGGMGEKESDWAKLPDIASMVSYPTMFELPGGKHLVYFRTGGHSSSWSYRITADNGKS